MAPRLALAALLLLLLQRGPRPARGAWAVYPKSYCGVGTSAVGELDSCTCKIGDGACLKAAGTTAFGTNYGFMGDITLAACEAKCLELGCGCFDFSDTPARPSENCRICKAAQTFMPLSPSGAGYAAHIYQPELGWSIVSLVLGLAAAYVGLGTLHGRMVQQRAGWEALPHRSFWREARGLVEDGVRFATGKGAGRHGGGSSGSSGRAGREALVPSRAAESSGGGGGGSRRSGGEKKSRHKSSSGSGGSGKKSSKAAAAEEEDRSRGGSSPQRESSGKASPAAGGGGGGAAGADDGGGGGGGGAAAASTASGGGGRWVHVPT